MRQGATAARCGGPEGEAKERAHDGSAEEHGLVLGSVNPELAEEIAKDLNVSLGNVKLEKFANGEIYARYQESVRGADVFLVPIGVQRRGLRRE